MDRKQKTEIEDKEEGGRDTSGNFSKKKMKKDCLYFWKNGWREGKRKDFRGCECENCVGPSILPLTTLYHNLLRVIICWNLQKKPLLQLK